MENRKIAVLIPVYNGAKTIARCLSSVDSQTYGRENIQVIIFDDGSTDNTQSEILPFMREGDLYIRSEENKKRGYARNKLVERCNTEYAMWLDADDEMFPDKIKFQYEYMVDFNYAYTHTAMRTVKGSEINFKTAYSIYDAYELMDENPINGCTVMFKVEIAKKFKYNEDHKVDGIEDWDMWKKVLIAGYRIHGINISLLTYNMREEKVISVSERKTFRFDDICVNSDMQQANAIARELKSRFPYCRVIYCISPLVHNLENENEVDRQRCFPKIFNAYSDIRNFFAVDKAGIPTDIPEFVELASHCLFHVDHRLLTESQQEMSLIASCSLAKSKIVVPPFNKWTSHMEKICEELNLELIKFEDGWASMEHEKFNNEHTLWYLHHREWDKELVKLNSFLDGKH